MPQPLGWPKGDNTTPKRVLWRDEGEEWSRKRTPPQHWKIERLAQHRVDDEENRFGYKVEVQKQSWGRKREIYEGLGSKEAA